MCNRWTEMWRFELPTVTVVAEITDDQDLDLSWDEDGETAQSLESGKYQAFGTRVRVLKAGVQLGEDSLWGSIYDDPRKFFTDHRDSDPLNRNCSLMRAERGNVVICHYFPEMVRMALINARATLFNLRA